MNTPRYRPATIWNYRSHDDMLPYEITYIRKWSVHLRTNEVQVDNNQQLAATVVMAVVVTVLALSLLVSVILSMSGVAL